MNGGVFMQNNQKLLFELHTKISILAEKIITSAQAKNILISSAESCTGGTISHYLTAVSGASKVFRGGICAYQDQVKQEILGVPANILSKYTAVSPQTAQEMAKNVKELFLCDFAISTTGYAGPGGGDENNPVGTVFIALATNNACTIKNLYFPDHTREEIQLLATYYSLQLLDDMLNITN